MIVEKEKKRETKREGKRSDGVEWNASCAKQ